MDSITWRMSGLGACGFGDAQEPVGADPQGTAGMAVALANELCAQQSPRFVISIGSAGPASFDGTSYTVMIPYSGSFVDGSYSGSGTFTLTGTCPGGCLGGGADGSPFSLSMVDGAFWGFEFGTLLLAAWVVKMVSRALNGGGYVREAEE